MIARVLLVAACLLATICGAVDIAPVHSWTVSVGDLQAHDISIRRGETVILQPTFIQGTNRLDLADVETVTLRYRHASMTNYYTATGSVYQAGSVRVRWTPAQEGPQQTYLYEIAAAAGDATLLRAFGRISLDPGVGSTGAATTNRPAAYTLLDLLTTDIQNAELGPWPTTAAMEAYVQANSGVATALQWGALIGVITNQVDLIEAFDTAGTAAAATGALAGVLRAETSSATGTLGAAYRASLTATSTALRASIAASTQALDSAISGRGYTPTSAVQSIANTAAAGVTLASLAGHVTTQTVAAGGLGAIAYTNTDTNVIVVSVYSNGTAPDSAAGVYVWSELRGMYTKPTESPPQDNSRVSFGVIEGQVFIYNEDSPSAFSGTAPLPTIAVPAEGPTTGALYVTWGPVAYTNHVISDGTLMIFSGPGPAGVVSNVGGSVYIGTNGPTAAQLTAAGGVLTSGTNAIIAAARSGLLATNGSGSGLTGITAAQVGAVGTNGGTMAAGASITNATAYGWTNGVALLAGTLTGTNGVYFTRATNAYWILLP